MSAPDIVEFVTDPQLLGLSLSPAQETLLRAIYGLPMAEAQLEIYRACTGRAEAPAAAFDEVTVIAGARAGKDSRIAAPIVCYEALFGGHQTHLVKGERGVIPLVAQDQRATKIAFGYIRSALTGSPLLASQLHAEPLSLEIPLTNGLTIACFPSTLRSLRGWSMPVGVMDEVAFYRLEGQADSDAEIQASIRRGMLSFPSPRLVKISTPYLKSGILYEDFRRYWGQDSPDVLVWRASSLLMNPSLNAERLESERRKDPERFAREYEGNFAEDLQTFLPAEVIEAVIVPDRRELPRIAGVRYIGAVDPSGGGADTFTFAIVHLEGPRVVHDVMRGWAKGKAKSINLEAVVREIVDVCRSYGVGRVVGDRYAGDWVRQAFFDQGLTYQVSPWTKADAYLALEPVLLQGHAELLDHRAMARELNLLERRYHAGGRVSVDHPSGHHDDHANALALAVLVAKRTNPSERDEEDLRPDGSGYRDELERAEELTKLKQQALERGMDPAKLAAFEADVRPEHLAESLREWLEAPTLRGRLRRSGLPVG